MRTNCGNKAGRSGFTLADTMIAIMILGIVFSGILLSYSRAAQRAEYAGYALAAEALSIRQMERFHAVVWDTQQIPILDNTTNLPQTNIFPLDLPVSGTNVVYATSSISMVSFTNAGPSYYKMITINTVFPWNGIAYTNTLVTYRCPDQ